MLDLSIVIVSWNTRELVRQCLASIDVAQGQLTVETFVVDNASSDGTQERTVMLVEESRNNVLR